jgi:hypothetical protein
VGFAVKHNSAQTMAPFATIELHERAAALGFVIDEVQGTDGLVDSTKFRDALRQARRAFADLQRSRDAGRGDAA